MYGDYECPYSSGTMRRLTPRWRDGGSGRLVWRHFPQPDVHAHARGAAAAAEAAHAQGRFGDYHDRLLANQDNLTAQDLRVHAARLGLDVEQFVANCGAAATRDRIERDLASARASGVNGTPVVFVDGDRWEGDVDDLLDFLGAGEPARSA